VPEPGGWGVDYDDEGTQLRAAALAAALIDLRPFWPKVVDLFRDWEERQFQTEGTFWGTPWKPLSPQYAAWKAAHAPTRGILVLTGALKRAATTPTRIASPRTLTLRIDDKKARWHHYGEGNNPARPLLMEALPPQARLELDQAAEEYVDELATRFGF
jgi:hypothetical protein